MVMKSKEEYIAFIHMKIDEWDSEIDLLRDRLKNAENESRVELQEQISSLIQKRDEVALKTKEIQQASVGALDDIKAGVELAEEVIRTSLESAFSRFIK
jgi:hypothetical protein